METVELFQEYRGRNLHHDVLMLPDKRGVQQPHHLHSFNIYRPLYFMGDKVDVLTLRNYQFDYDFYNEKAKIFLPAPSKVVVGKPYDTRKLTAGKVEVLRHSDSRYKVLHRKPNQSSGPYEEEILPDVEYYAPWEAFEFAKTMLHVARGYRTTNLPAYHSERCGFVVKMDDEASETEDADMKSKVFNLVLRLEKLEAKLNQAIEEKKAILAEMGELDPGGRVIHHHRKTKQKILDAIKCPDE